MQLPIMLPFTLKQACEELGDAISLAGDKDFALKVYQQCGAGQKVREFRILPLSYREKSGLGQGDRFLDTWS